MSRGVFIKLFEKKCYSLAMAKKPAKKRNPIAKDLKEFKPQVVPDKTRYTRKDKHKKPDEDEV